LRQLVPVHLGHHDVGEQEIETLEGEQRDRVAGTRRRLDPVTSALQRNGQEARDLGIVVDD
jgi:hypothetical protein